LELVTGIEWVDGRAVGRAMDANGAVCRVEPAEFATRGLPSLAKTGTTVVQTNFKDWRPGSLEEYAAALDFPPPETDQHTVWTFAHAGRRYIVPTLALVRAIGRTRGLLYPHLFKPQSLDDLCAWDEPTSKVLVPGVPDPLPNQVNRRGLTHTDVLSWMYCFPSARRAWASVYQSSKVGRLHMDLPLATVAMELGARSFGRTDYVHSIRLVGVVPEEEPFKFGTRHTRSIAPAAPPEVEVLRGYVPLTDDEWNAIAAIVVNEERPAAQPREALDTMRLKAHDGRSWAKAAAVFGTSPTRVASLQVTWKASGKLQRVNERLEAAARTGRA
jgi:hypothetical protein